MAAFSEVHTVKADHQAHVTGILGRIALPLKRGLFCHPTAFASDGIDEGDRLVARVLIHIALPRFKALQATRPGGARVSGEAILTLDDIVLVRGEVAQRVGEAHGSRRHESNPLPSLGQGDRMLLGVGDGSRESDIEGGIELGHVHVLVFQGGQGVAVPVSVLIHPDAGLRLDGGRADFGSADTVFEFTQGIRTIFHETGEPFPAIFEMEGMTDRRLEGTNQTHRLTA